jgi:hypothetical protein
MSVDADDAIDLFCQHGHAVVLPSDEDDRVVGVGLGGITAWQNCDESRRWAADKLLIKPTKVGQADVGTPTDISAHKASATHRVVSAGSVVGHAQVPTSSLAGPAGPQIKNHSSVAAQAPSLARARRPSRLPQGSVTVTEMTGSSGKDQLAAVRAYASDVMGWPSEAVTVVTSFEDGNRHAVHRVSFRDASDGIRDVVVRVSFGGDASELAHAEREAAVLENVGGVAALSCTTSAARAIGSIRQR